MVSDKVNEWIAEQDAQDPEVKLLELNYDDSEEPFRIVDGRPDGNPFIYWLGERYDSRTFVVDGEEENIQNQTPEVTLNISSIDGQVIRLVELYELEGREVKITRIPLSLIKENDVSHAKVKTYKVQDKTFDRSQVSLTVGTPSLINKNAPWRRYQRFRCHHRFRLPGCFYPSDFFEEDTYQEFIDGNPTSAQKKHKHGIHTQNRDNANLLNVGLTTESVASIETNGEAQWFGSLKDGPFFYKILEGDFDVFTNVTLQNFNANTRAGILAQAEDTGFNDNWAFMALAPGPVLNFKRTEAGGTTEQISPTLNLDETYLRMERIGTALNVYVSSDGVNWDLFQAANLFLGIKTRIGLAISQEDANSQGAEFEYLQFLKDSTEDCPLTPQGCTDRDNTIHFGAYKTIPGRFGT